MTIMDLGKMISKKTLSKLDLVEMPLPKDDPHKRNQKLN